MNLRTLRLAGASLLSMGAILCTGIVDTPAAAAPSSGTPSGWSFDLSAQTSPRYLFYPTGPNN